MGGCSTRDDKNNTMDKVKQHHGHITTTPPFQLLASTHQHPPARSLPGHYILVMQQGPQRFPGPPHSGGPSSVLLPGPVQHVLDAGGHCWLQGRVGVERVGEPGETFQCCYDRRERGWLVRLWMRD